MRRAHEEQPQERLSNTCSTRLTSSARLMGILLFSVRWSWRRWRRSEPPVSRWAPPDYRGVGSPPRYSQAARPRHPRRLEAGPLHAGRAPAAVDRDLQQQPVAHPLKALQHAFLGHCGRVAWPRGFHPLGRPDHRHPGSLLEIAELHGCPPKIKSAALLALRPGHTRPAGLACWFLTTLGRVLGCSISFTSLILLCFSC
jgi:hypothetical protein